MKQRYQLPIKIISAGIIGIGCALYAPFAPFAFSWLTILKAVLWGALGYGCTFGLQGKLHRRLLRFALLPSFILALSLVLGAQLQVYNTLSFQWHQILILLGLWCLCFYLICHLLENVPTYFRSRHKRTIARKQSFPWVFLLCFFVVSSFWLLAYFPIMTNYDIHAHLSQIVTQQYETHHSLLYTLLIQGLLSIASMLGLSNTWALLWLGLLQMAIMGFSLAYGLITLRKANADQRLLMLCALYYCIFPLFGYFSFSTTKDTLFACFLLLTSLSLYRITREPTNKASILQCIGFGVTMCFFRYNGMLTIFLLLGILLLYALYILCKHHTLSLVVKRIMLCCVAIVVLHTGLNALLNTVTHATTPETVRRDMLSLPLQQMASVLQVSDNAEDIARIEGLFGVDDVQARYRSDISDPVKAAFLYPNDNTSNALRAWARLALRYPKAYVESFLQITRGAWYLDDLSHTKIDYWLDYTGYLETTQKYQESDIAINYTTVLPWLRSWIEATFMDNQYLSIPLLKYWFALAVQAWIAVFILLYALYHRRRCAILFALFSVCTLIPLFLLPCMISRYFFPLFMLNPLCIAGLTVDKEKIAS